MDTVTYPRHAVPPLWPPRPSRKHADELIDVSKQAEWKVIKTPQYEMYSNEFRQIADDLVKSAKDKNLDGAALSYVELTLTCVKCHKYVREVRWARND